MCGLLTPPPREPPRPYRGVVFIIRRVRSPCVFVVDTLTGEIGAYMVDGLLWKA